MLSPYLHPDSSLPVKVFDRGARGGLCDVDVHGSGVGHGALGVVGDGGAGLDVEDADVPVHGGLVAGHQAACDVCHGAVVLEVVRLADDLPVAGAADGGEGV